MVSVRIWDVPTRLCHWSLVISLVGLVITGNIGGQAMAWHFRLGQAVLSLLGFRLLWGLVGGHWSRWWHLPLAPASVRAYLRGQAPLSHTAGHNPLGSWSVMGLLLLCALQVGTGLFSDDDVGNSGPLSVLISGQWVSAITSWHKGPGKVLLLMLVGLHVAAIVWYRWRHGDNLVRPMLQGDKDLPAAVPASRDGVLNWLLALLCLALSSLAVQALLALGD